MKNIRFVLFVRQAGITYTKITYLCSVTINNMIIKTAEEVMRAVSHAFKERGYSHETAAALLGYGSKQTLSNIICKKAYLSERQAQKFHDAFDFSTMFLTKGVGGLYHLRESDTSSESYFTLNCSETDMYMPTENEYTLAFSWLADLMKYQENDDGLIILSEIVRFLRIRMIICTEMKYTMNMDPANNPEEFNRRVSEIQGQIVDFVRNIVYGKYQHLYKDREEQKLKINLNNL